jgi:NADPH:quinone reductase-like Zn-dependent oxidoreductase
LIKVDYAPVNPSDMAMIAGVYDREKLFKISYPTVPGWEGSGTVVANGGGYSGWKILGKRVAFVRQTHNGNEMR